MGDIRTDPDGFADAADLREAGEMRWVGLRQLGYRKPRLLRGRDDDTVADILAGDDPGQGIPFAQRQGLAIISVCTFNHAHYARTLFHSIRAFHPNVPLILVVADADR